MKEQENVVEYPLYLAGKAVKTAAWLDVHHKYQTQVFARVALADAKTLEKAIASAVKAEAEMAALKPFEKQKILLYMIKKNWWWIFSLI